MHILHYTCTKCMYTSGLCMCSHHESMHVQRVNEVCAQVQCVYADTARTRLCVHTKRTLLYVHTTRTRLYAHTTRTRLYVHTTRTRLYAHTTRTRLYVHTTRTRLRSLPVESEQRAQIDSKARKLETLGR